MHKSVLLVSIIWIAVLANLAEGDVTCTPHFLYPPLYHQENRPITARALGSFINTSIWSALEPSMAVICTSIPSLHPLYSIAIGAYHNIATSASRTTKRSSTNGRSSRLPWPNSRSQHSEGMFRQLEEQGDDTKAFGHGISIRGGRDGEHGEAMELPPMSGIHVKSGVLISTEKLEYKDRLF
ncbi:MAG: hypothetical protein Q9226_008270 [Calogaya cf. arnoldii]